jgi:hypothetical protein
LIGEPAGPSLQKQWAFAQAALGKQQATAVTISNAFFRVSLTSRVRGSFVIEFSSLNDLGLDVFDAGGVEVIWGMCAC